MSLMIPNGGVRINWSHPLAGGLIGCWVYGVSKGINLAGTSPDLVASGVSFDVMSPDGPIVGLTSSPAMFSTIAPPEFKSLPLSLFARTATDPTNPPSARPIIIGVTYDNAGTPPFSVATIFRDPGTADYFGHTNNAGSAIATSAWSPGGLGTTDNIGLSIDANSINLYGNGV